MNNIQAKIQVESCFLVKNINKKSVRSLIGHINQTYEVSKRRLGQIFEYTQAHMLKTIQNKTNIRY